MISQLDHPFGTSVYRGTSHFGHSRSRHAWSVDRVLEGGSLDPASSFLKHALSTITSTAFLEVMVIYRDRDFCGTRRTLWASHEYSPLRSVSQTERAEEASRYNRQLEVFPEAQTVRDFQLVLCADVWDRVRALEGAVEAGKAKGVFDNFSSEPMVIHNPQATIVDERDDICATYVITLH